VYPHAFSHTQKNPRGPKPVKYVTLLSDPQLGHAWRSIGFAFWAVLAFFSAMVLTSSDALPAFRRCGPTSCAASLKPKTLDEAEFGAV
jgi:hypothetical protein